MYAESYGDRAHLITKIAEERKLGRRLVRGHPMIEAEVVYAAQNEYCETAEDFIARRTRLAFLDVNATRQALPRVSFYDTKKNPRRSTSMKMRFDPTFWLQCASQIMTQVSAV